MGTEADIVIEKQPYEKWPLAVDFTDDLEPTNENIVLANSTITAEDVNEDDATSSILAGQKALATSTERTDARVNASLQEVILNGDPDLSPYKVTYRIVTDAGNQFEKDIIILVSDR